MATTSFLLQNLTLTRPCTGTGTAIAATRRSSMFLTVTASSSLLLSISPEPSGAFDFRMTVPDQTVEEAESAIRGHARSLLGVRELFEEEESWKGAQKELRKRSALLKQDIYTIIQGRPAAERAQLRRLYAELFKGVARMDYAARDKDRIGVWEWYDNVAASLDEIMSTIYN